MRGFLLFGIWLCGIIFFWSASAQAQMLVGATQEPGSRLGMSGILARSSVGYDYENNANADVDRTMLGLAVDYQLNMRLRLISQLVYSLDSEWDNDGRSPDGDGFMLGLGLNCLFHQIDKVKLYGHGFFNMSWDQIDDNNLKVDQNVNELHLGSTALVNLNESVNLYGGLDFVFYSKGEIKIKNAGFSYKMEAERDSMVSLLAGLVFQVESIAIRPQVTLGAEQTVAVSFYTAI